MYAFKTMSRHLISRLVQFSFGAALAGIQGCSTQVKVAPLSIDLAAGEKVDGIPFRMPMRYSLKLYELVDGKYKATEVTPSTDTFADMTKLYKLQVEGKALSQGAITFKLNPDGTPSTLKVVSTSKGQDILSELGTSYKNVAVAKAALEKSKSTMQTTAETDLASTEDRELAALVARQDADLAVVKLNSLSASTTAADRKSAEQAVEKARLIANQKARRAGLPPPFDGS